MPALDLDEDNNTTTRLLTLLNVSALKSSKCKRTDSIEQTPRVKLNKRRSVQFQTTEPPSVVSKDDEGKPETSSADLALTEAGDTSATEDIEGDQRAWGFPIVKLTSFSIILEEKEDPYEEHFGAQSSRLSPVSQGAVERNSWRSTRSNWRTLGSVTESIPKGSSLPGLSTNGNPVTVRIFPARFPHDPLEPLSSFCQD